MTARVPRSIRLRLTLWYVLILAVLLAASRAGVYLIQRQDLYASLDRSIRNRANTLLEEVIYKQGRPTLAGRVSSGDAGEDFVRVWDASGRVTFDSNAADSDHPVDPISANQALEGTTIVRTVVVNGEPMRVRTLPIRRGDSIAGVFIAGVLEVGQSQEDLTETLEVLLLILAVAYPVTLGVASIGGLTRLARRISAEDLSERLDMNLPDEEVGRLAKTFDEMIARLDSAFRRQREFTADASHELRTPFTVLKGQIEVALQRE